MQFHLEDEVQRRTGRDAGRKGTVVELNEQTNRARVKWHTERGGSPCKKPIMRTWVRYHDLMHVL